MSVADLGPGSYHHFEAEDSCCTGAVVVLAGRTWYRGDVMGICGLTGAGWRLYVQKAEAYCHGVVYLLRERC